MDEIAQTNSIKDYFRGISIRMGFLFGDQIANYMSMPERMAFGRTCAFGILGAKYNAEKKFVAYYVFNRLKQIYGRIVNVYSINLVRSVAGPTL